MMNEVNIFQGFQEDIPDVIKEVTLSYRAEHDAQFLEMCETFHLDPVSDVRKAFELGFTDALIRVATGRLVFQQTQVEDNQGRRGERR